MSNIIKIVVFVCSPTMCSDAECEHNKYFPRKEFLSLGGLKWNVTKLSKIFFGPSQYVFYASHIGKGKHI